MQLDAIARVDGLLKLSQGPWSSSSGRSATTWTATLEVGASAGVTGSPILISEETSNPQCEWLGQDLDSL